MNNHSPLEVLIEKEEIVIRNDIGSFTYSLEGLDLFFNSSSKKVRLPLRGRPISELEMMRLRFLFLAYSQFENIPNFPENKREKIQQLYLELGNLEMEIKEMGFTRTTFDQGLAEFIESWIGDYKRLFLRVQESQNLKYEEKISLDHINFHSYEYKAIVTSIASQWGPDGKITSENYEETMKGIVYQVFVVRNGQNKNKPYASVYFPETDERRLIELKKISDGTIASLPIYDPSHASFLVSVLNELKLKSQIMTIATEDGDSNIVLVNKPERTVYGKGKPKRDFIMSLMPTLFISNWDIIWMDSDSSLFSNKGYQSLENYMLTDDALRFFNNIMARHLVGAEVEVSGDRFIFKGTYNIEKSAEAFRKLLHGSYTSDVENDVSGTNGNNCVQLYCGINGDGIINLALNSPHHTSLGSLSKRIMEKYSSWLESMGILSKRIKINSKQKISQAFLEEARARDVASIVGYNINSDLRRIAQGSLPFNNPDAWDGSSIFIRGEKAFAAGSFIVDVYKYLSEIFSRWGNVKLPTMMQVNKVDSPLPISVITPYLLSKGITKVGDYLSGMYFFLNITRDLDGLLDPSRKLNPNYRRLEDITDTQINAITALSAKCAADTEGTRLLYEKIKDELIYLSLMTGITPGQVSVLSLSEMSNNLWNRFRKSRSLATPSLSSNSIKKTGEKIILYDNVELTYDPLEFLDAVLPFLPKRKQKLTKKFLSPDSLENLNPIDVLRRYEIVKRIVLEPVDYLLEVLSKNEINLNQVEMIDGRVKNIESLLTIYVYSRKNGRDTPVKEETKLSVEDFQRLFIKQYGMNPWILLEQMKSHKKESDSMPSPIYSGSAFKFYNADDLVDRNRPGIKGKMIILNDYDPSKNRLMIFQGEEGYTFYNGINLDYCMFSPWAKNLLTGMFEGIFNRELFGNSDRIEFTKIKDYLVKRLDELVETDLLQEGAPGYFSIKLPNSSKYTELPDKLKGSSVLYLKKRFRNCYRIENNNYENRNTSSWDLLEIEEEEQNSISVGSIYSIKKTDSRYSVEKIDYVGNETIYTTEETIMSLEQFLDLPKEEKEKYVLNSEEYIDILDGSAIDKILRPIIESTEAQFLKGYNGSHLVKAILNIWTVSNTESRSMNGIYLHRKEPLFNVTSGPLFIHI